MNGTQGNKKLESVQNATAHTGIGKRKMCEKERKWPCHDPEKLKEYNRIKSKRWRDRHYVRKSTWGYISTEGYKYIKAPSGYPYANISGYVRESRVIAEKKIGRYLNNNEHVHHINKIKTDNRPENLLVINGSEHTKLHGVFARYNKVRDAKGSKAAFYGKHHTEATKQKMSSLKKGKKLTEEHKQHMRDAHRRRHVVSI
jgi:hypothetical protein